MTGDGVNPGAVTGRALARFGRVDPFRFALGQQLVFQHGTTVSISGALQFLVPDFAEPAAFLTLAVRRVE